MVDRDQYSRFIEDIELRNLSLFQLSFRRDEAEVRAARVETNLEVKQHWQTDAELVAEVGFSLRAVQTDPVPSEDAHLEIEMVWRLNYELAFGGESAVAVTEELVEQFLYRNVPINVWPYIRETVTSLTGKMGVEVTPLVLPTLKIVR